MQAHDDVVEKYRGEYSDGWDALRERRYRRQLDLELFEEDWAPLSDRVGPEWADLPAEKREEMDERMAIYAAQIEIVDRNIGRLDDALERRGELDDTLFLFLSDNGACAEFDMLGSGPAEKLNEADLGPKRGSCRSSRVYAVGVTLCIGRKRTYQLTRGEMNLGREALRWPFY